MKETKEITTPIDKHKVVLKSFITGRDSRELKNVYFKDAEFYLDGAQPKSSKLDMAKLTQEAEDKAIEIVVVSVDGKEDNKVDAILDMRKQDSDFVISEINKVANDENFLGQSQKQEENIE